jgi:hypothetical protein
MNLLLSPGPTATATRLDERAPVRRSTDGKTFKKCETKRRQNTNKFAKSVGKALTSFAMTVGEPLASFAKPV